MENGFGTHEDVVRIEVGRLEGVVAGHLDHRRLGQRLELLARPRDTHAQVLERGGATRLAHQRAHGPTPSAPQAPVVVLAHRGVTRLATRRLAAGRTHEQTRPSWVEHAHHPLARTAEARHQPRGSSARFDLGPRRAGR